MAESEFEPQEGETFAEVAMPEIEAMAQAVTEGCVDFSKIRFWEACETAEVAWDEAKDEGVEITHTSHARDGAASSSSDDSESGYRCCVCGRRDDSGILVCLKCGRAAHSACYFRPGSVDEGDSISRGDTWLCASCGGPPQAVMATGLAGEGAQDGHGSGRGTKGEDDLGGDAKRIQVTGEVVGERHKRVSDTVCL